MLAASDGLSSGQNHQAPPTESWKAASPLHVGETGGRSSGRSRNWSSEPNSGEEHPAVGQRRPAAFFISPFFPKPWSAVIGENGGDFKHNQPRRSAQNGILETKSGRREVRKRQIETGSLPFEIPSHIAPEKPWTYDHGIRDKRGESMISAAVPAPKRRLFPATETGKRKAVNALV